MAKSIPLASGDKKQEGRISKLRTYLIEVWNELGKVTWPTREDLKAHTIIVMIFLAIFSVMIGVMDVIFQRTVLAMFSWL